MLTMKMITRERKDLGKVAKMMVFVNRLCKFGLVWVCETSSTRYLVGSLAQELRRRLKLETELLSHECVYPGSAE